MGAAENRYTQVKISVAPELVSSFKAVCAATNVSMASVLSQFMMEYCGNVRRKAVKPPTDYSTRRKRRVAVKRILIELEKIRAAEEGLIDNAPPNLRDAPIYETAGEYISALDEATEQLDTMAP